jgi:hypothetical protein
MKFTIPDNTWVHLTMRADRSGTTSALTAKLDGTMVSTISNLGVPPQTNALAFGLLTSSDTDATTLEVDNFSLTLE